MGVEKPFYSVAKACMVAGITTSTYTYRKRRGDPIPQPDLRIGRRAYFSAEQLESLKRYHQENPEWQRPLKEEHLVRNGGESGSPRGGRLGGSGEASDKTLEAI